MNLSWGRLYQKFCSAANGKKYEQLCRSGKTPVQLKERLTIVLLADDGLNNREIAKSRRSYRLVRAWPDDGGSVLPRMDYPV